MSRTKKLLITILAPVLGLLLFEGGLRLGGFTPRPLGTPLVIWNSLRDGEMRAGRDMHEPSASSLWAPRPGALVGDVEGE